MFQADFLSVRLLYLQKKQNLLQELAERQHRVLPVQVNRLQPTKD